jgi:hypothetical protein
MTRRGATIAVVLLVVLAGCGGTSSSQPESPDAPTTGTETQSASPGETTQTRTDRPSTSTTQAPTTTDPSEVEIPVRNGSLSFNHTEMYRAVQTLVGRQAPPPSQIVVRADDGNESGFGRVSDPFARTMLGVTAASPPDGPTTVTGISLTAAGDARADTMFVLAHEYAHEVQFETAEDSQAFELSFTADTHQEHRLGAIVVEGSATHVARTYMRQHTKYSDTAIRRAGATYANLSGADRYDYAPYYYGERYVAAITDSPSHWWLYDSPPNTTEQVLHNLSPGSEPPRALTVTSAENGSVVRRDTMGELFVRLVLRSELSRSRAVAGADGWGNDRLLGFEGQNYAWTLRWDDSENATEFRDATRAYLDARGALSDGVWRLGNTTVALQRVSDDTVTVLVGSERFTEQTTVTGTDGEIHVSPP